MIDEDIIKYSLDAVRLFEYGHALLLSNTRVLLYLKDRHIPLEQAAFIPLEHMRNPFILGLNPEFIERIEDAIFDRVFFRIYSCKKRIIGFIGRALDGGAKYLYKSISPKIKNSMLLFGLEDAATRPTEELYIVEGVPDKFAMNSIGLISVAALGAHLTPLQAAIVVGLSDDIIICFDADSSGFEGIPKAARALAQYEVTPRLAIPPTGLDPDEMVRQEMLPDFYSIEDYFKQFLTEILQRQYVMSFASQHKRIHLCKQFNLEPLDNNIYYD